MTKEKTRVDLPQSTPGTGRNSLVPVPVLVPVPAKPPPPWRTKRAAVLIFAAAAIALAVAWWGLGGGGGVPLVPVESLTPGPVQRVLAVSGRTVTDVHSDIVSSVSARVLSVNADEGDPVQADAALLVLDDTQQQAAVRQAAASLDAAILAQQRAQEERDRAVALAGTMSPVAVAEAGRALATAGVDVVRLEAALDRAQLALRDYRISAPITGVVLSRSVEPGDLVSPSQVLMRLANKDNLQVEVQIDEIYAGEIRAGQRAQLRLAGRTEIAAGTVSFVASEVDEVTGSMRVKLSFVAPIKAQIGLTTVANILIDEVAEALTVPRSAFVETGAGTAVFILRDGRAVLTPITYTDWPADRVEVTSGLSARDTLVLSPDGVEDGMALTAQNSPDAGE